MSRRTQRNVGIIGLGIIGQRVSENLRRRGFSVFVWNRTPRPLPNFVGSPAEIAQLADYIQIFVSDDEALLQVVQKLKQTLKAHHIVMAHCTVAPHTMRAAAEIVQRRGAQFLDAPFTGSKVAAEKGELVYYIGGDDAAFRRARPVLEASSKELIEIGEIGQATIIKIATNMVTAATVQVAAEALALVRNAGMPAEKFVTAMRGNASNSATLTMKLPKMIAGDFEPHFSVKHMLKDAEIASRLGRSHGLVLGATEAARDSLLAEVQQGRGDFDYTSLVRVLVPAEKAPPAAEIAAAEHPMLDLTEAPRPQEERPVERKTEEARSELRPSPAPSAPTATPPPADSVSETAMPEVSKTSETTMPEVESKTGETAKAEVESKPESMERGAEPELDAIAFEEAQSPDVVEPEELELEEPAVAVWKREAEAVPYVPTAESVIEEATPEIASAPEEPVATQGERRGFFSRMFSKDPHEKDADY